MPKISDSMSICVVSRRHEWSVLNENPSKTHSETIPNLPQVTEHVQGSHHLHQVRAETYTLQRRGAQVFSRWDLI